MDRKQKDPKDLKDPKEELEELIQELIESSQHNENPSPNNRQVKIVRVPQPPATIWNRLMKLLYYMVLNGLVIASLSGFIQWVEVSTISSFVFYIFFLTVFEEFVRMIIQVFIPKEIIMQSFGTILWIGTALSFSLVTFLTPGFEAADVNAAIAMFFSFMIFRGFLRMAIMQSYLKYKYGKIIDNNKKM